MIQRRRGARLSAKTFEGLWVFSHVVRGEKFKRMTNRPREASLGFVHNPPMPPPAQLFDDSVARDGLPDHGANHTEGPQRHRIIEIHPRCIDCSRSLLLSFDQLFEVQLPVPGRRRMPSPMNAARSCGSLFQCCIK